MDINTKILIVEDDIQISNFISYILKKESFNIEVASNGKEAIKKLENEKIDILLLDLGLPDLDGIEIIKKLRTWSEIPVIIISARDQESDKVKALDLGADDYITKPFSAAELIARIKVSIRHTYRLEKKKSEKVLSTKNLILDKEKRKVFLKNKNIHVTPLEYNLLILLFENIGKVVTTNTILKEIYGPYYGNDTQSLRTLIAGLRRKIEKDTAKPCYILTEIGVGYRLIDE